MYKLRVEILRNVPAEDEKVFLFTLTAKKVERLKSSIKETALFVCENNDLKGNLFLAYEITNTEIEDSLHSLVDMGELQIRVPSDFSELTVVKEDNKKIRKMKYEEKPLDKIKINTVSIPEYAENLLFAQARYYYDQVDTSKELPYEYLSKADGLVESYALLSGCSVEEAHMRYCENVYGGRD